MRQILGLGVSNLVQQVLNSHLSTRRATDPTYLTQDLVKRAGQNGLDQGMGKRSRTGKYGKDRVGCSH
jgi:hypothetical protein